MVTVPGSEGDFAVLEGHAPLMSTIRDGDLLVQKTQGAAPETIAIRGGFAEVAEGVLTVLAERATPVEDLHAAQIDAEIKDAEDDLADAKDDATRHKASDRLDQLKGVKAVLATAGSTH